MIFRFLLLFIFFKFNFLIAAEPLPFNNIVLHKNPLQVSQVKLKDFNLKDIEVNKNDGKIKVLNFWATWCEPCKREMPSLDDLATKNINLKIYAINLERPNKEKTKNFFKNLNIKNIDIYFDPDFNLAKQLRLRGIPTTILLNERGNEIARIIGEIDFSDKKFVQWLKKII
tara:strand:- start:2555 stop:3067 length:513 start_codon:yes stop_codon:yes gene_type:complete